ncbi:MAG: hypothetical protein ACYSUI_15760 [Planctomycetota bacterium]
MRIKQAAAACLAAASLLPTTAALGGGAVAFITSPDGTWTAGIDASGQVVDLLAPGMAGMDSLFESIVYVAVPQGGLLSERIELLWQVSSQLIETHQARTILTREGSDTRVEIRIVMLDGPGGGAKITVVVENTGPLLTSAGAFLYADLDIAATSLDDEALVIFEPGSEDALAIEQFDKEGEAEPLLLGGAPGYAGYQVDHFPDLRLELDLGVAQLSKTDGTVPGEFGDHTAALDIQQSLLLPGEKTSIVAQIGGVGGGAGECPWDCQASPDGSVSTSDLLALVGQWGESGSCDFDGGGTGTSDVLSLIGNWGPCPGNEPECPWDCEDPPDGTVDAGDLLALLSQWGGPGSCDFNGNGVSTADVLALVAHWGECP